MRTEDHIRARIGFFVERGYIERLPSPWQLKVGWVAMLPVTLAESERERGQSRRTLMGQVPIRVPLQILYSPRQLFTDTGVTQRKDQIVRHVLSVFHEDAFLGYDLQLLHSHDGGLELLRREARRVVERRTAWAGYLERLVGGPGYHARLIELAEAAERFAYPDPKDLDPRFASLVGFARFCGQMPDWPDAEFYGFDLGRIARRWW
jgi:hypothetical protein